MLRLDLIQEGEDSFIWITLKIINQDNNQRLNTFVEHNIVK